MRERKDQRTYAGQDFCVPNLLCRLFVPIELLMVVSQVGGGQRSVDETIEDCVEVRSQPIDGLQRKQAAGPLTLVRSRPAGLLQVEMWCCSGKQSQLKTKDEQPGPEGPARSKSKQLLWDLTCYRRTDLVLLVKVSFACRCWELCRS
ncbi:hypothetical protein MRB53_039625 [Persea americana]|nr:hypothetical protein MRB53_039625 [Persea americana]